LGGRKLGVSLIFPAKEDLYGRLFQKRQGVEIRLHPERPALHKCWFKTKVKAKQAEAKKREELENSPPAVETPTDNGILGTG
jgi:hypothetical protein